MIHRERLHGKTLRAHHRHRARVPKEHLYGSTGHRGEVEGAEFALEREEDVFFARLGERGLGV